MTKDINKIPKEITQVNNSFNQTHNLNTTSSSPKKYNNTKTKNLDLNKDNNIINTIFYSLTLFCYLGTACMMLTLGSYWKDLEEHIPDNYKLPEYKDFYITLKFLPVFIIIKLLFEKYVPQYMYILLSKKYKNPNDINNFNLGNFYKKKLATNLLKVIYYTFISIFAYCVMKESDFFPYELLGKGDMWNIFSKGVPGYLFFEKPDYFNYYYLIGLAFVITDLIWLLFIYEKQSDFPLMLLHHSVTISLVVFSYLFNCSQIGVIVFILHDYTDIFVYITRIAINTDLKDIYKYIICGVFLALYIYLRLYVLGKLIISCFIVNTYWGIPQISLWSFKNFLIIMHVYWVYQIIIRFFYKSITDVGKVKQK